MRANRRRLLVLLAGAAALSLPAGATQAQQVRVLRVQGELTAATYPGLEAFLFNSMDTVIGLDVSVEEREGNDAGTLSATVDADGRFIAYVAGRGESEIVVQAGAERSHGSVRLDGFYVVKYGGLNQGITSLFLQTADEASVRLSGRPIVDISVDRLDPKIRKAN